MSPWSQNGKSMTGATSWTAGTGSNSRASTLSEDSDTTKGWNQAIQGSFKLLFHIQGDEVLSETHNLGEVWFVIAMIQWATLIFQPIAGFDGLWHDWVESPRTFGLHLFYTSSSTRIVLVVLSWLILSFFLLNLWYSTRKILRDDELNIWFRLLHQRLIPAFPVLFLPFMSLNLSVLDCTSSGNLFMSTCWSGSNLVFSIFSTLASVICFFVALIFSGTLFRLFPQKKDFICVTTPRFFFLFFLVRAVVCALESLSYYFAFKVVYFLVLIFGSFALGTFLIWFLPFYHNWMNFLLCGTFFSGTAFVGYYFFLTILDISAWYHVLGATGLAIPIFGLFFFFAKLRQLRIISKLSKEKARTKLKPWEWEIAARFSYFTTNEEQIESASVLLMDGLQILPHEPSLVFAHAVFLLITNMEELQLIRITLNRLRDVKLNLEWRYYFSLLHKQVARNMAILDGGEAEVATRLEKAHYYEHVAKIWTKEFWHSLAKQRNSAELPNIVSTIDKYENKAQAIHDRLLSSFPKNPTVLRAAAIFTESFLHDPDRARSLHFQADFREEERGIVKKRARRKRENNDPIESHCERSEIENYTDRSGHGHDSGVSGFGSSDDNKHERLSDCESEISLDSSFSRASGTVKSGRRSNVQLLTEKSSNSPVLRKLQWSSRFTIFIAFVDILIVFILLFWEIENYSHDTQHVQHSAQLRILSQDLLVDIRDWEAVFTFDDDLGAHLHGQHDSNDEAEAAILELRQHIKGEAEEFHTLLVSLIGTLEEDALGLWNSPSYTLGNFSSTTQVSLMDLLSDFIQYSLFLIDNPPDDWTKSYEFHYIMDVEPLILKGLSEFITIELGHAEATTVTMTWVLIATFACTPLLISFVILFAFRPVLRSIKWGRENSVALFLTIPLEAVISVYKEVSKELKVEHGTKDFKVTLKGTAQVSSNLGRAFTMRYFGVLFFLFLVLVPIFGVIGVFFVSSFSHLTQEIDLSAKREFLFEQIHFYAEEVHRHVDGFTNRSDVATQLEHLLVELTLISEALVFGNSSMGLPPATPHQDQVEILYETLAIPYDHDHEEEDNVTSSDEDGHTYDDLFAYIDDDESFFGLDSILSRLKILVHRLLRYPPEQIPYKYENYSDIQHQIVYWVSHEGRRLAFESKELYVDQARTTLSIFENLLVLALLFAFPAIFISYFILKPMEGWIRNENKRVLKMLAMLPGTVDSLGLDSLINSSRKGHDALKLTLEAKHLQLRSALDRFPQGFILVNHKGVIDLFNNGAERIFQWKSEEIQGKQIETLVPKNIASKHQKWIQQLDKGKRAKEPFGLERDLSGRRKDGTEVLVHVFLEKINVNNNLVYVAVVSDEEKLDLSEREKARAVIHAIFPHSIAEDMIHSNVDWENPVEEPLVAKEFPAVTVAFCDIVGFTQMASKTTGTGVLKTLSTLFNGWDVLCKKHQVEKIKTIGDAFMIASGCPTRSPQHAVRALEWSIDVLASVKQFNSESGNGIKIRVGISSGSCVAGILGTMRPQFDLWGATVHRASLLESKGEPGRITVCGETFKLLKKKFHFEEHTILQEDHSPDGESDSLVCYRYIGRFAKGETVLSAVSTAEEASSCGSDSDGATSYSSEVSSTNGGHKEMLDHSQIDLPLILEEEGIV